MKPVIARWTLATFTAAAALAVIPSMARADEEPAGEIGLLLGVGRADADLVGGNRGADDSPVIGLRGAGRCNTPLSLYLEALYGQYETSLTSEDSKVIEGRLGVERIFRTSEPGLAWFLSGGLGYADVDYPSGLGDFGRPLASAGIGLRIDTGRSSRLRIELRGEQWIGDDGVSGANITNGHLLFGWSIALRDRGPVKEKPLFEEGKKQLTLKGVNFVTDSAELTPQSRGILDRVAASLKDWPDVRVEVGGHTDSIADDQYNLDLSQRRAESVRSYLVGRGIAASRLEAKGYGESEPIADNDTAAGRAKNRRVVLTRLDR
jgi:outer membrane protein OmpA-like peptidoglycan-associated protein